MELLKKVRETIKKYSMLSEGDHVLIGLSGGADSICLTAILDELKKDFNLSLNAVYVDHGLRPAEVKEEIVFCEQLCERLGIGFFSKSVNVMRYVNEKKLSVQEAARELRYQVFDELSMEIKATRIALGHTADDQTETFLMRLLRGSGKRGLSGIPPVRSSEFRVQSSETSASSVEPLGVKKNILIIRPLIEVERGEVEEFLAFHSSLITHNSSLPFIVDSSNLKKDYFRNWIRLMVIPELKKRNPALIQNICRTADISREEDAYLEVIVTKTLMRLISRKSDDTIELFLSPLEIMEKPILRRVLRRAISETVGINRGIDFVHIEDMIELIKKGKSGDRITLPKCIKVIREPSLLVITSKKPVKIGEYRLQPPCELAIEEADIVIKALFEEKRGDLGDGKSSVLLDAGNMNFPLKIRSRVAGDFFFPLGFGKRRKLQDFFVDEKIPRNERDKIPIVVSGDDIMWVSGYRADERFRITDRTEKFLRLIISNT